MLFDKVLGQDFIKNHLITSTKKGRIPHAQLFVGKEGTGTLPMAIAYAKLLLSSNSSNPEAGMVKLNKLQHPDLHFSFPTTTTQKIKKDAKSDCFLEDWREFVTTNPYGNLYDWMQFIGAEKKQGFMGVHEAKEVIKKLTLKPFESNCKVMIIWMAEKMNQEAANKLLKLVEEPPEKTIFILVTENEDLILNTIKSRCQSIQFLPLSEEVIANELREQLELSESEALKIAHQSEGNFTKALHLAKEDSGDEEFEKWFITWIRAAFKAKGNPAVIQDLVSWSDEIAKAGRETQKQFLEYCIQFFRQAMLINYKCENLAFLETKTKNFDIKKFAPFVHGSNILDIQKELRDALYHIERNGNGKIILLDLSMKLTRLLHKKEATVS